jgi:hypothetical protein
MKLPSLAAAGAVIPLAVLLIGTWAFQDTAAWLCWLDIVAASAFIVAYVVSMRGDDPFRDKAG